MDNDRHRDESRASAPTCFGEGVYSRRVQDGDGAWAWEADAEDATLFTRRHEEPLGGEVLELSVHLAGRRIEGARIGRDASVARWSPDPRAVLVEGETMIRPGRHAASSVVSTERSTRRMFAFRFHRDDDAERCFALVAEAEGAAAEARLPASVRALLAAADPESTPVTPEAKRESNDDAVASLPTADAADERAPMDECAPFEPVVKSEPIDAGDATRAEADSAAAPAFAPPTETVLPEPPSARPTPAVDARAALATSRGGGDHLAWMRGLGAALEETVVKAHAKSLLRRLLDLRRAAGAKEPAEAREAADAFGAAPVGASVSFERYVTLASAAWEEMIDEGEVVVPGGNAADGRESETDSDEDVDDASDADADPDRFF